MIWISKRPKYNPGKINAVLAFNHIGFQFLVEDTTTKQWAVDLFPQITIASNVWIYFGVELTWFTAKISIFWTRPKFNEGLKEEMKILEEIKQRKSC